MQLIPAIDIRGGHCVRLLQGDFDQETIFGDDPAAMAARWEAAGATRIHLVDLDGAKSGRPINVEAVRRILATVKVPCQLGGGIRDESNISTWLQEGLEQVVVGTQALRDPDWFGRMTRAYPNRLILGLDARDGQVATQGWLEVSSVAALALAREFDSHPMAGIIYTDIARDGTLEGPNLSAIDLLAQAVRTPVIASGGVGKLEDLKQLSALPISGCIIGRALYDGRFTLEEALSFIGQGNKITTSQPNGEESSKKLV